MSALRDAFVHVPVGLVATAASKAKQRITVARLVGQLAVTQAQRKAQEAFERTRGAAEPLVAERLSHGSGREEHPPTVQIAHRTQSGPGADSLAITGYDSLSATQVLPRLEGLTADELEAVRAYEDAHRGRRTILGRIAQLQAV